MNNNLKIIIVCLVVLVAFATCKHKPAKKIENSDTAISGSARFVVDDSFQPILAQELYVFKSLYTDTKPQFLYKTENDALRLFLNDSIRTAILARDLSVK